jgi:hypothetical protein
VPNAANTPASSHATNGNQTSPNTVQFANGFPFPFGLTTLGTDPETSARRQFGPLVSNARNLIRAGVYPPAVELLRRVLAGAPGTRIAGQAQRMLAAIPTL